MKTAASVFSWLGAVITTIISIISISLGQIVTRTYYDHGTYSTVQERVPYPGWIWFIFVVIVILRIIILIWREYATSNGKKVGCGVMTLIFCSVIGGILTLCIPEEQLYGSSSYKPISTSHVIDTYTKPETTITTPQSEEAKKQRIEANRNLLVKGIITQEEFDNIVREINGTDKQFEKPEEKPLSQMSEDEIANLIIKYSEMKDKGIITEEEFEAKKKELLSKK